MKRSVSILIIGFIIGTTSASVCHAAKTEISFWNGITASDGEFLVKMCKQFEKETNIKVKMQRIVWDTMYDKLLVSLAAGKPPEVFIVHPAEFQWFMKSKAYRPLDAYLNGPNGIPKSDRVSSAWKAAVVDGKTVGIPLDNHINGMYLNMTHFAESGLDPNKPPTNYDEFVRAGAKCVRLSSSGKVIRQGFLSWDYPIWPGLTMLNQFGGTFLSADKKKAAFNSEAGIKAAQSFADLKLRYKMSDGGGVTEFLQGKGSMVWGGPWEYSVVVSTAKKTGMKLVPASIPMLGTEMASAAGSHIMFIPPIVSGKKLEAAWKFVKWMSDHSIQWSMAGQIPVRKSALNSKEFAQQSVPYVFSKMLPYAVFEPSTRRGKDVRAAFENAWWQVYDGRAGAKQAMDKAADEVNRILASVK